MSIPTAEGCISLLEDKTANALAALAEFQSFTDTANSAAARLRIYGAVVPGEKDQKGELTLQTLVDLRPFAKVWVDDGGVSIQKNSSSPSSAGGATRKTVQIWLERAIPVVYREDPIEGDAAADRDFRNHLGKIWLALHMKCQDNSLYPAGTGVEITMLPRFTAEEDRFGVGSAIAAQMTLTVGDAG